MKKMKKYVLLILVAILVGASSIASPIGNITDKPKGKELQKSNTINVAKEIKKEKKTGPPAGFKRTEEITSFPWNEGFENGGSIPTDWSQTYVSGSNVDWVFRNGNGDGEPSNANTGSYNALLKDNDANSDETKLISPALNFSLAASAELTFYLYMERIGAGRWGNQDILKVYYKTSAWGSWILLDSYTSREKNWDQKTITLPNISSTYYIAFEGNAMAGEGVVIDDIEVTIVAAPPPPPPITVFPWTEDFEDGGANPADWTETLVSGITHWLFLEGNKAGGDGDGSPITAYSGLYNACFRNWSTTPDTAKLVSPPLDISTLSGAKVKFWLHNEKWLSDQDELNILYKTSATGTWIEIASYNTNINTWTEYTLDLPNPSADYYIAFEGNAKYGYGVCLDDITVFGQDVPTIDFSADNVNPDKDEIVQFTDMSSNVPISWTWSFSPNTVTYQTGNSNSQNPAVSFNAAGIYAVTLTAANGTGSSTGTKTNYIYISETDLRPNALEFDGVNQYVSIDNSLSLNIDGPYTDRTIEAWFYCTDVSDKSRKQVIFEEGDATRGFNIYIYDKELYVGAWNDDPSESDWKGTWLFTDKVFSNKWHHIALRLEDGTNSPTNGKFSGVLDGIQFDEGEGAKVYAHTGGTNIGRTANSNFHDGTSTTTQYFAGIIDEVRIWNEARTNEEIRANMFRQLSGEVIALESNLAAYYTMDHSTGTNLRDFSGNSNDGTLSNMSDANWIASTVLYDLRQSLDFDGIDDYVSLGNSSNLQLTTAITIETWVNPRSISQWGAILSNLQDNGTNESGYGLIIDGDTEEMVWWLQTVGGATNDHLNYPRFTPTLDTWQHVACTYNGSEMKLYVDGILKQSLARNGAIDWSNLPIEARIGSYVDDNENYYFDGQIDDVRIYDRALTASQIAKSMNDHLWGTEDNLIAYYRFDQLNEETQSILYNIKGDYSPNLYIENFDIYANRTDISTLTGWDTWSGGTGTSEDTDTRTNEASSPDYSMRVSNSNDIIYRIGDLTTGKHSIKFRMFVNNNKSGYFNLEHYDAPGTEWAVDVFFDNAGNGSVTTEGNANAATFSFNNAEWFTVETIVDLDADLASLYINSTLIHTWQWSINNDGSAGANQLGCVDFYANAFNGTTPFYYIDDFSVTKMDDPAMNGLLVNMEPTIDWEDAVNTNLWTGAVNTNWANSSNWLTGGVPISTDVVRIDRTETGYYPILTSDQAVDKITIAEGASVEVQLNQVFDISTSLVNYGSMVIDGTLNLAGMMVNYNDISLSGECTLGGKLVNNGDFNILSNADVTGSLIDNGDISGYGDFAVQRFMSSSEKWHLISAPISNAYARVFLDRYLLTYNEASDTWNNILIEDVRLREMNGYATMTNTSSPSTETYEFVGDLNTGDYTYTLSHSGTNPDNLNYNLIGNPYASSIDWQTVTIPTGLDNAIYTLKPDGQYAIYANRISTNGGLQNIAPGQGFWVRVNEATAPGTIVNLTLTNANRTHSAKDEFFKSAEGTDNEYQFSMFARSGKITDETVLVFNNATQAQFDSDYDAYKFMAYERNIPNIYYIGANDERLAIDTRPQTPTVGVGFAMNENTNNVKINVKEAPNFAAIILEDLFNGEKTDLLVEDYTFNYLKSDSPNRFKLHFSFLGIDDVLSGSGLQIYSSQSDIIINSVDGLDKPTVQIFDLQGRLVYEETLGYITLKRIPVQLEAGNYIVRLIAEDGVLSEKVFIQ